MAALTTYCYVGSYCGAPKPEAMSVLTADPESGALRLVQTVYGVEGSSYLQLDRAGRWLYTFLGDERERMRKGRAVRFAIGADGRVGKMETLALLPCATPCHLTLSPEEDLYAFAAYGAGTAGTLPTAGGKIAAYVFPDDAMGPNRLRQQKAYAHFAFFTPKARRLGVIDLGCDRIRFFEPRTMTVDPSLEIKTDAGDGPRHAVWSKDGRFLFVLNELGSSVASYRFDGRSFAKVGKWTMLPADFNRWLPDGETLATKAAAIRLTNDGKVLMASNRGHDSIAIYAVDGLSGELTLKNIAKLRGRSPRDFALMPGERFVVVGYELDNAVESYRFDREHFTLTPVGSPVKVWRPVGFALTAEASLAPPNCRRP